jgi:thioredoxin reductase
LHPSVTINGGEVAIAFTETQDIAYELGAGADVRAAEFECMSLYTNLNNYPQLHDGIATDDLVYQFENGAEYNTVDFEFFTNKVNSNDGDKRSFGVMLATDDAGVFAVLQALMEA